MMTDEQRRQHPTPKVQGAHAFTFYNSSKTPLKPKCFWRTLNFFLTFGYFEVSVVFVEITMIMNYTHDILFTILYSSMRVNYIVNFNLPSNYILSEWKCVWINWPNSTSFCSHPDPWWPSVFCISIIIRKQIEK